MADLPHCMAELSYADLAGLEFTPPDTTAFDAGRDALRAELERDESLIAIDVTSRWTSSAHGVRVEVGEVTRWRTHHTLPAPPDGGLRLMREQ